jgi:hypothetical protein
MKPKKTGRQTIQENAPAIIEELLHSFVAAYKRRSEGMEENQVLIQFDIIMAGTGLPKAVITAHRIIVQNAFRAFAAHVPLHIAKEQARLALLTDIYRALTDQSNQ